MQKLLAARGIASRRSCESLIKAGRVTVNGVKVTELGTKADPDKDDIRVNNVPLMERVEPIYIVLNKPTGYVTTVSDPHARHTVMDLVEEIDRSVYGRVYPVGRLDVDSAGLLFLTNDGEFTERLTHPSHQVTKTYRVLVRGEMPAYVADDLRGGILLEDGMTAPAQVEWVDFVEQHNLTIMDITIHEGRNRQVRRMLDFVGYPVLALTRTRIGPISLKGLAPGTWRKLHPNEVKALLASADSTPLSLPRKPTFDITLETDVPADAPLEVRSSRRPETEEETPAPKRTVKVAVKSVAKPIAKPTAAANARGMMSPEAIRAEAEALAERLRAEGGPDILEDDAPATGSRGKHQPRKNGANTPRQPHPAPPKRDRKKRA